MTCRIALTQLSLEIDKFCDMVPTPMSSEAAFGPFLACRQFGGHPKAVEYLEALRDELKERVANGVQAANPERFRYIFDVSCPYFNMGLLALAQQKYGAVVVADHIARWRRTAEWLTDPDDPVGNLANKQQFNLGNENYQPGVEWRDQVLELAQKTKADAAIFWNNIGCRTGASDEPDTERKPREETGGSQPHHRLRHSRPDLRPHEGRRGTDGRLLRDGGEQQIIQGKEESEMKSSLNALTK